MLKNIICCIPARAGSKRLPGKNTLPLNGLPMLGYAVRNALQTGLFEEVFVCTEDAGIAEIARGLGASVPELAPEELCGDLRPSHDPCRYLARRLNERGAEFNAMLCLQPTSPLLLPEDIRRAAEKFLAGDWNFLISVTPIDPHYFHWAVQEEEKGKDCWSMYFGNQYMKERPLLPPVFRPNGAIKMARLEALEQVGNFFGPRLTTIETPEERSVHVATRFDFDLCEFLLKRREA